MPFSNPIVGGSGTLIRNAIQSPNYVAGVSGWSINRDGTAEFAGGSFRGPVSVVDGSGNTLGGLDQNGNFTGNEAFLSEDIFVDGLAVVGAAASSPSIPRVPGSTSSGGGIIDSVAYGMVAYGPLLYTDGLTVPAGGHRGIVSQAFQAELGRAYEITLSGFNIESSVTDGYHEIAMVWHLPTFNGDQTATTPAVGDLPANYQDLHTNVGAATGAKYHKCFSKFGPFRCGPGLEIPFSGLVQFILHMRYSSTGTITYRCLAQTTTNTAFCNVYDLGPFISATNGNLTGLTTGGSAPPTQTYTKTYSCSDSGTFNSSNAYLSNFAKEMLQGYNQGTGGSYGTTKSMAIFPSMTADLSGATITAMSLNLHNHHWWYNAGGTAVIGLHGSSSLPGTFSENANAIITSSGWAIGATKTLGIPSTYWAGFKAGTYKGITLNPGNSGATYYGRFDGQGYTYPPSITVTYTK